MALCEEGRRGENGPCDIGPFRPRRTGPPRRSEVGALAASLDGAKLHSGPLKSLRPGAGSTRAASTRETHSSRP